MHTMYVPCERRYYGAEEAEPLFFMCGSSSGRLPKSDMSLDVQVFSDVNCPWGYVGKRRLERALATGRSDVSVCWLQFQLDPQMPKGDVNRRDYRSAKFGSWERSLALVAQLTEVGWAKGMRVAFEKIWRR